MAGEQDQRVKVFVSHIHEEAALGKVVKDGLEDAFASRVAVFVSSDPRDNPGGERWLDRLERELKDPQIRMLISLVSPQSVREPWISIELGAAWIRQLAVFPLCHSGQELGALPRPLGDFGGADLDHQKDSAERLLGAVEKSVKLEVPKKWARAEFLADMRKAAQGLVGPSTGGAVRRDREPRATVSVPVRQGHIDLEPEEVRILQALAQAHDAGNEEVPADVVPGLAKLKPTICTYHADRLFRLGLIYVQSWSGGKDYKIKPDGIGWLVEHRALPK